MEKAIKFLGICIIVGCIILSLSLIYINTHADRFYLNVEGTHSIVLDKQTGEVYYLQHTNNNKGIIKSKSLK